MDSFGPEITPQTSVACATDTNEEFLRARARVQLARITRTHAGGTNVCMDTYIHTYRNGKALLLTEARIAAWQRLSEARRLVALDLATFLPHASAKQ